MPFHGLKVDDHMFYYHRIVLAASLLYCVSSSRLTAQVDTVTNPPVASVAAFALGTAMSVYTHELGHLSFDYLVGANSVHIELWPPRTHAEFTHYPSNLERSIASLAGPLTTRALSEAVDCFLNRQSLPRWLSTVGGAWYLAMRFDLPWQVLTSSVSHIANTNQRDDLYKGVIEPWFPAQSSRNLAYALLIISQVVDIYLDADEISDNYNRLIGKSPSHRADKSSTFRLRPCVQTYGIAVSYSIRF